VPSPLEESVSEHPYKPPRHDETKKGILRIEFFVSLCLNSLNIFYVLRQTRRSRRVTPGLHLQYKIFQAE